MIGNKIKYIEYHYPEKGDCFETYDEGLVVDAYTNVRGSVSGHGETLFGFGESRVSGKTDSTRMYKVEHRYTNNDGEEVVYYNEIRSSQLTEILEFSNQHQEEKFKF